MSIESIVVLVVVAALLTLALWWHDSQKQKPLAEFGLDNVRRVLNKEHSERREEIFRRGTMSSAEWVAINRDQLKQIDAELKRRDIEIQQTI
jgi:hypothetical protein